LPLGDEARLGKGRFLVDLERGAGEILKRFIEGVGGREEMLLKAFIFKELKGGTDNK